MTRFDVVICGYGPTGAVAANLLGQRAVRTLVVERSPEIFQIPRAVHYDGESMRIFQQIGLAQEIREVSGVGSGLCFLNGRGRTLLAVDPREFEIRHAWPSANFFSQPLLEARLRRGASRHPGVEVRLGWALEGFEQDGEEVRVRIRRDGEGPGEEVAARYLLGCDGASSATRELAGLELDDLRCDEPWLVCDVLLPEGTAYRRTVYQICDYRRPTSIVPCEDRHIRWEFMVRPGDDPVALEREESVRALMAPHLHRLSDGLRPDQGRLLRSKVYTFHGLVARRWRAGRVLILGDAAHQTPPFLGQGMCAGLRDALNLCWKLGGVIGGRFHPDLLETYRSEREPHVRAVVGQAIRIGGVIQARSRTRALLRDAYFGLARLLPRLKRGFSWEPAWPLGPGLFDAAEPPGRETAHGNPMDQPFVERISGERVRLDDVLGDEFVLLGWNLDPANVLGEATAKTLAELRTRLVHVVSQPSAAGPESVVDVDGGLARWLERVGGGRAVLLRPDRQVFGVYGRRPGADLAAELEAGAARLAAGLGGARGAQR